MMFRTTALIAIAFALIGIAPCFSQTLISTLPDDGTWAIYDFVGETTQPDGNRESFTGTFTIRSVGTERIENENVRWLELEQEMDFKGEAVRIIDKLMVAEDDLTAGADTESYLRKMWRYHSQFKDPEPRLVDLASGEAKTLGVFLPTALAEQRQLDAKDIETPTGPMTCTGLTGVNRTTARGIETTRTITVYSNPKSPFGSVLLTNIAESKLGDRELPTMNATLTLKEIGRDAVSSLPSVK